jgi:hypothetical protein
VNLADALKAYQDRSATASTVARQLAFAGIAIVWVFSGASPINGKLSVPQDLLRVGFFLVIALACDFLQYVWGALAWGVFHRSKETNLHSSPQTDFLAPAWINYPAIAFFWAKLVMVMLAYVLLGVALGSRLTM